MQRKIIKQSICKILFENLKTGSLNSYRNENNEFNFNSKNIVWYEIMSKRLILIILVLLKSL